MAVNINTVPSTAKKPEHGERFVCTRAKARQLYEFLVRELPVESKRVAPAIKQELDHSTHDTHICFYIEEVLTEHGYEYDIDGHTALQIACMEITFSKMETF